MNQELAKQLVGRWVTDPEDEVSRRDYGEVTLEFGEGGWLTYTIHGEASDQQILLTYTVADGMLITDQPSAPREERTAFRFTPDGKPILAYDGGESRYIRVTSDGAAPRS